MHEKNEHCCCPRSSRKRGAIKKDRTVSNDLFNLDEIYGQGLALRESCKVVKIQKVAVFLTSKEYV